MIITILFIVVAIQWALVGRAYTKDHRCIVGHKWSDFTPWHPMNFKSYREFDVVREVGFRRNRYCVRCAKEQTYDIGKHVCEGRSCNHKDIYISSIDHDARMRQLEKELNL